MSVITEPLGEPKPKKLVTEDNCGGMACMIWSFCEAKKPDKPLSDRSSSSACFPRMPNMAGRPMLINDSVDEFFMPAKPDIALMIPG